MTIEKSDSNHGNAGIKSRFGSAITAYIQDSTRNGSEMVDVLISIMRDEVYSDRDIDGGTVRVRQTCRVGDRIAAIDRLFDRGFGKVAQTLEIEAKESTDLDHKIETMTVEELESTLLALNGGTVIDGDGKIVT